MKTTNGAGVWIALAAAVLIGVGSLGPWAKTFDSQTMPGTEGDGVITLVAALVALGAVWMLAATGKWGPAVVAGLIGLGVAVVGVFDYIDINDTSALARELSEGDDLLRALEVQANADILRNPAWGIYLVIAGGAALAVASFVALLGLEPARPVQSSVDDADDAVEDEHDEVGTH